MMQLHSRIKKSELSDPERFDFLKSVKGKVLRLDEIHPSADNDGHYLFLVWFDPSEDTKKLKAAMKRDADRSDPDREWTVRCLPDTGDGLVIVSTWLG